MLCVTVTCIYVNGCKLMLTTVTCTRIPGLVRSVNVNAADCRIKSRSHRVGVDVNIGVLSPVGLPCWRVATKRRRRQFCRRRLLRQCGRAISVHSRRRFQVIRRPQLVRLLQRIQYFYRYWTKINQHVLQSPRTEIHRKETCTSSKTSRCASSG